VDRPLVTMASVLDAAVLVAGGRDSAEALSETLASPDENGLGSSLPRSARRSHSIATSIAGLEAVPA
jgi:hypothetical protein